MVKIDNTASLESFRKFIIASTCSNYAPESYVRDSEIFAEREEKLGSIYVEAADKVTLKKIREITFVNARDVLGIIYNSKSGNTALRWRQTGKYSGKVMGEASHNTLVNLAQANVINFEGVREYIKQMEEEKKQSS